MSINTNDSGLSRPRYRIGDGRKGGSMAKIMVVSNQAYLRSILSESLAGASHRVVCVDDAKTVCRHCSECRPDLILLDLFMDGVDSWALFHQVKCYAPDIPVMVYALKSVTHLERLKESIGALVTPAVPPASGLGTPGGAAMVPAPA
jgi:CheY-like chemotaxis protein